MRKTKIICTMGPAVENDEMIEKLIDIGMDCARFNFSHGDHAEHHERIERVKRVSKKVGSHTALLLDTKGPEIRMKDFVGGKVQLKKGQEFTLDADEATDGDETRIALTYHELYKYVKPGVEILADDGKLHMRVDRIEGEKVVCIIENDAPLSNHKSINIPNCDIPMPFISDGDRSDILFAIEEGMDYIAASFVRSADDVLEVRKLLDDNGGKSIKIISKIESTGGMQNFNEILKVTDGVMVARGDLGVEIPYARVPSVQKAIISRCIKAGVFVVTATQMLDSMMHSPSPTRAEVSDVANAIYDGTTCIMLSGETAAGEYPIEAVRTMANVAIETEANINYAERFKRSDLMLNKNPLDAVCNAAVSAAEYLDAKAIIAISQTGRTISRLADFYPSCPVIAGIVSEQGRRQMNLGFNVKPMDADRLDSVDKLVAYSKKIALEVDFLHEGDTVVIVMGSGVDNKTTSDTMKIDTL